MQNPTYLERSRHGVFYIRWPVPKRLHPVGKPSSVKVSLATREPREALRLARQLGYLADLYMSSGMVAGMRFDEIRASLARWFQTRLQQDRERIAGEGRFEPEHLDALRGELSFAEAAIKFGTDLYADIPGLKSDAEIIAGYREVLDGSLVGNFGQVVQQSVYVEPDDVSQPHQLYKVYSSAASLNRDHYGLGPTATHRPRHIRLR